ncbi:cysteine desulfurase NifS [Intestinibacillus massiliensis]|uniref:cysteine desulfurase NifS n=1 Tax=Intestinibacillus massiliensis TaxID=1871029 RepID=UPI000B34C3B8|nr:cysteine desulfurase NifS [Intestinibacillus massiliensis]
MKRLVYTDNAATTPISKNVYNAMQPWLTGGFGNPSSLYGLAWDAKRAMDGARATVAKGIGCDPDEIIFTGGGSQADNLAIKGFMPGRTAKGRKHIITSKIEHHAVLYTCQYMETLGYRVTYLDVDAQGRVDLGQLRREISEDTALVTIMAANNEIGTIQPLAEIAQIAHEAGALFHTDAVQGVGHMPIDVHAMDIDMLSLTAHKIRGPKGIGALYVKKGIDIVPLVHGGGQERGKMCGTENIAGIVGLAEAVRDATARMDEILPRVQAMRDRLVEGIMKIPYTHYTGDPVNRLPGTASFIFEAIEGEGLIMRLNNEGICGSTGSACSTGSLDPSHVLMAIGLPHEIAHGSLRLTLGEQNTEEEVDYILEKLPQVVETLRSMSPVWENGKPNMTAATELHAH